MHDLLPFFWVGVGGEEMVPNQTVTSSTYFNLLASCDLSRESTQDTSPKEVIVGDRGCEASRAQPRSFAFRLSLFGACSTRLTEKPLVAT